MSNILFKASKTDVVTSLVLDTLVTEDAPNVTGQDTVEGAGCRSPLKLHSCVRGSVGGIRSWQGRLKGAGELVSRFNVSASWFQGSVRRRRRGPRRGRREATPAGQVDRTADGERRFKSCEIPWCGSLQEPPVLLSVVETES